MQEFIAARRYAGGMCMYIDFVELTAREALPIQVPKHRDVARLVQIVCNVASDNVTLIAIGCRSRLGATSQVLLPQRCMRDGDGHLGCNRHLRNVLGLRRNLAKSGTVMEIARAKSDRGDEELEQAKVGGRAERRVELLSAFARGIICEFDRECRYRDVWATDERLLAMPSTELIGRTIVEALGEEVGRPLMEGTERVFLTGAPETHEYTLGLAVGRRAFEARIVRIRAESGPDRYRAAALIRDVTEEKEVERKLGEAERLAALGVLAAGVGHEINNPLMVVQENTRLVSQALGTIAQELPGGRLATDVQSLRNMLQDVLEGVRRMQRIVADLRLFRRENSESKSPVDVRSALETAITLARPQIEQRALLETSLDSVPLVAASEGKLGQVFLNLLINATHAIPEGDARAQRIRVSVRPDARGWATVEIADTGCGIPPEELGKIFDPFFTTKREGMGLGLSICQRILTDCGGTITAESQVGRGTTFRVSLRPHTAQAEAPASAQKSEAPGLPRLRLLIVDDEPGLLRVLAHSLSDEHDVMTAEGCDAALGILRQNSHFDVILCDLMMPLGDGMNFYERLAQIHSHLRARVVFMTGGAFTSRARTFVDSVPNRTIEKPFGPDLLRRVLADVVRSP